MSIHLPITGGEAADRLAIRELVDAYAHCADRRDAEGQMAQPAVRTFSWQAATGRQPASTATPCGTRSTTAPGKRTSISSM